MISFAASTGEGTLINYGTITFDEFYDIVLALQLGNVTIIVGPSDGTGE